MQRILKKAWYIQPEENRIETMVKSNREDRYQKTYEQLFQVDFVSDSKWFFAETPFTYISWK